MEKGKKCLALTVYEDRFVWLPGRVHEVIDAKVANKIVVVAVREDHRKLIGGNGVITVPPKFCFDSMTSAGQMIEQLGAGLDKFIQGYKPDSEEPPVALEMNSSVFASPDCTKVSHEAAQASAPGSETHP